MSIDKRLIIETFENKSSNDLANGRNFLTKELTKYFFTFLKTTETASLIYQKLKKRKNGYKKAKKLKETKTRNKKKIFCNSNLKKQIEK